MKTIKDLLVAMINATLILVALCLFLLWQVSQSTERIASSFAGNLQVLEPVATNLDGLRREVGALRGDLAALTDGSTEFNTQAALALQSRANQLQQEMQVIGAGLRSIADTPDRLMVTAITTATDQASAGVANVLNCQRPET